MRKQTKLVAVLSAAALLAIGASMTSFAAAGWAEENGTWVYLDKDGDRVTEEWKKSGNQYFWLDENGEMAIDQLVEDGDNKYYVDANGARVVNQWVSTDNDDDWEDVETVWYYFASTGKAYDDAKKTINGKTYVFDEGGYMISGWHERELSDGTIELYYLGTENEGWAYTGWQFLEPDEDWTADDGDDYDDEEWFNFKSSGVARKSKTVGDIKKDYIGGSYYGFDSNGVMVSGWVPPEATNSDATFYTESGNQPKGWVLTFKQDDPDENDDPEWFYLNSKGKPFNGGGGVSTGTAVKYKEGDIVGDSYSNAAAKYIKSKTYLFADDGVMLTGVYELTGVTREGGSSGLMKDGMYYFNKNDGSAKGQMETGKTSISYDGENYYYNFDKNGLAYTEAIVDGCLYDELGVRVNADEGNETHTLNYPVVDKKGNLITSVGSGDTIIISSSGKVKKSGTVTIDGDKYTVKDYKATPAN